LLVYKDLSDIWRIGWEHHRQRRFGANLNHPVNDLNCLAIRKIHETNEVKDGICRISGGVVSWNIRTIIEDCCWVCRNVLTYTISQMNDITVTPRYTVQTNFFPKSRFLQYMLVELCKPLRPRHYSVCFFPFSTRISNNMSIFHRDMMFRPWQLSNDNLSCVHWDRCREFTSIGKAYWQHIFPYAKKRAIFPHYSLISKTAIHYSTALSPVNSNILMNAKRLSRHLGRDILLKATFFMESNYR
jgi:hypothetical protein